MTPVITANIEKLGFKVRDIKIMLSSHAHFDHIGGHAAMKKHDGRACDGHPSGRGGAEAEGFSPLGDRRSKDGRR